MVSTPSPWILFGVPCVGIVLGLLALEGIRRLHRWSQVERRAEERAMRVFDAERAALAERERSREGPDHERTTSGAFGTTDPTGLAGVGEHAGPGDVDHRPSRSQFVAFAPLREREASGVPGWPSMGRAVAEPGETSVDGPPSPLPQGTGTTTRTTTGVPPDVASPVPGEGLNPNRQRWLERNAELMRRLDAARLTPQADQGTINELERAIDVHHARGEVSDDPGPER